MSEAIATVQPGQIEVAKSKYSDDATFKTLATVRKWIPNMQFYTSNSTPCKSGEFPINTYGIYKSKKNIINVGKDFHCLVLGWRPKAVDMNTEKPTNFYDPKSEGFQRCKEEAAKPGLNGFLCGPDFLLYIPGHGFVTFLMSSTTARNEADAVNALIGKAALFSGQSISNKKHTWWGPAVVESKQVIEMPLDEYHEVKQQFENPPESDAELAPEDAAAASGEKREV